MSQTHFPGTPGHCCGPPQPVVVHPPGQHENWQSNVSQTHFPVLSPLSPGHRLGPLINKLILFLKMDTFH